MIIKSKEIEGQNLIESNEMYYYCTYDNEYNVEIISSIKVNGKTFAISNIFGATTMNELAQEIINKGLK